MDEAGMRALQRTKKVFVARMKSGSFARDQSRLTGASKNVGEDANAGGG